MKGWGKTHPIRKRTLSVGMRTRAVKSSANQHDQCDRVPFQRWRNWLSKKDHGRKMSRCWHQAQRNETWYRLMPVTRNQSLCSPGNEGVLQCGIRMAQSASYMEQPARCYGASRRLRPLFHWREKQLRHWQVALSRQPRVDIAHSPCGCHNLVQWGHFTPVILLITKQKNNETKQKAPTVASV